MNDRPTAVELLEAVRHFLETDVVPALEGTRKFHARVAANLMSVLAREWELEEPQLDAEWERLAALLGGAEQRPVPRAERRAAVRALSERLCERIRAGDADAGPWRRQVLEHLRRTGRDKLAVSNPKFV